VSKHGFSNHRRLTRIFVIHHAREHVP
jgi:hypothetical protein